MTGFYPADVAPELKKAVIYALVIDFIHLLRLINGWLVSGFPRSSLTGAVVITGGSSGLGLKIAGILGVKGHHVVILDLNEPKTLIPNTTFIKCDISDRDQVMHARDEVLESVGKVAVLINNAGVITRKGTVLDLGPEDIEKTLAVNLKAHFWTTQAFLPGMIGQGSGHVVTVCSTMAKVGPAKASAYAASKGGALMFHESMTHEFKQAGIKTLLVLPGQLDSDMFHGLITPNEFCAPVVNITQLATQVVESLEKGHCGELSSPLYASMIDLTRALPMSLVEFTRSFLKIDDAMDTFKGDK